MYIMHILLIFLINSLTYTYNSSVKPEKNFLLGQWYISDEEI